jgi:hypothetical protein
MELRIHRSPLFDRPPLIVREVCKTAWANAGWPLQDMGFDQLQLLAGMIDRRDSPRTAVFPSAIRAEVVDDTVILRR